MAKLKKSKMGKQYKVYVTLVESNPILRVETPLSTELVTVQLLKEDALDRIESIMRRL